MKHLTKLKKLAKQQGLQIKKDKDGVVYLPMGMTGDKVLSKAKGKQALIEKIESRKNNKKDKNNSNA